ncbi:MAG: ABC transporter ATP-binding protein [Acetobacter peroxydans]|jgi:peptide/nickel transport system ATP-binding protein|nr:ABC transporter ATP-binding protein [Acetobacter peroxydans]MCI2078814.1 ABC transporter ATP-binding protein [Acetobacter peroxydans]
MEDGSPVLEVRELSVGVRSGGQLVPLVERISFTVQAREIVGLVGESGCGKSITAMALMGLLDSSVMHVEGSIRFRGQELVGLSPRHFRKLRGRSIAMVFQDPMTAFTPVYTVGWQIDEQIIVHEGLSRRQARQRTLGLLADMGVPDPQRTADSYPHQLSGGLRQRAMIAMALSCRPQLLIADEPTTALDVTVQAQILDLLRNLRRDHGSSVLMITHDMGVVAETCDAVAVFYAGRVAEMGSALDVFSHPAHPYTAALLASIPPLAGPRPHRLPAIAGAPPSPAQRPVGCAFAPRCSFARDICAKPVALHGMKPEHQAACVLSPDQLAFPVPCDD